MLSIARQFRGVSQASSRGVSTLLNGIDIASATLGDPKNPPVLLVMGHSGTMAQWTPFDQKLADKGFHVIKFDNRDMGLTQRFDDLVPNPHKFLMPGAVAEEGERDFAYTIDDMADDAVAVLDHHDVSKAHVIGCSMGGLISQVLGVRYQDRCRTLTPIMTACNINAAVGRGMAEDSGLFIGKLMSIPPPTQGMSLEEFLENRMGVWKMLMVDPQYPEPNPDKMEIVRNQLTMNYHNGAQDWGGTGGGRQSLAINAWEKSSMDAHIVGLQSIKVPTMVMHGIYDPLIPLADGRELAGKISNSRMVEYVGGHNLGNHPSVMDFIVNAIVDHITPH